MTNVGLKRRRERRGYSMSPKEFKVVSMQGRDFLRYNWLGSRLKSLDASAIQREVAPYLEQGWEMTWVLPVASEKLDAVLIFLERGEEAGE
jgi:hypothetical protein